MDSPAHGTTCLWYLMDLRNLDHGQSKLCATQPIFRPGDAPANRINIQPKYEILAHLQTFKLPF